MCIRKKYLAILLTLCFSFNVCLTPAMAATTTDRVGVATTLYQQYVANGATGAVTVKSNVSGKKSVAEPFIYDAIGLATRLTPFSLDAQMQYYSDANPTTFFVTFRGRELNDQNTAVQAAVKKIATEARSKYSTDLDRLRYINEYLVDHCSYNTKAINDPVGNNNSFTAYGCLIEGSAVCEGYTNAVQMICDELGIPSVKVTGKVNNGNHIWNSVYVNGKWWMLDVTFNDPVGTQVATDRWQYFLLNIDQFNALGKHVYNHEDYEISKQILTGRTSGQGTPVLKYKSVGLTNSSSNDRIGAGASTGSETTGTTPDTTMTTEPEITEPTTPDNTIAPSGMTTLQKAESLKMQGLFMGDEQGFRLEDNMTRVEMGVMVMKLNGGQELIATDPTYYEAQCIFTDVPTWGRAAIGYLYDNQLIAGQGDNLLGTGDVSKKDYAVVLLRFLGISHSYDNAVDVALEYGILTQAQVEGDTFATRGDIVEMTFAALQQLG